MATTQELLSAVTNMQPNAQAALPVIPNNGNPQGAYNMPSQTTPAKPPQARGPDLSFLKPSQGMQDFSAMLQRRQLELDGKRAQQNPATGAPMQLPVAQPQAPVLPMRSGMESSNGLVLPQRVM